LVINDLQWWSKIIHRDCSKLIISMTNSFFEIEPQIKRLILRCVNHRYQLDRFIFWNWATDKKINIKMCEPQIKKTQKRNQNGGEVGWLLFLPLFHHGYYIDN